MELSLDSSCVSVLAFPVDTYVTDMTLTPSCLMNGSLKAPQH